MNQLFSSLRYFLYSPSVCSFHLFLISLASTRSLPLLSFIVPIFGLNIPVAFPFFQKRALVFLLLFFPLFLYTVHRRRPSCLSLASLSMEFSRQEYWRGLPFPSPGDLPNPGTKSRFPASQADSLPPGMPLYQTVFPQIHSLPPGQVYDYGIASKLNSEFQRIQI